MVSFIHDVLLDLNSGDEKFSEITFILPNKRSGVFLKTELGNLLDETAFAPAIISIEEFVEHLSELKNISNTELLFEFYSVYSKLTKKELLEPFDSFSKWAQILIQDFNEIDRYLIPQEKIFDYLSAIKDVEHWSVQQDQTELVKNYLSLWKNLHLYYDEFSNNLKQKKAGYQGLIYREAVNNIQSYIQSNEKKSHVFVGFNALNTAEEMIIQELLENGLAKIYWDIDDHFLSKKNHDAALFARQYKNNWNYFNHNSYNWIISNYTKEKNIQVIGIPKNVGQAKYIGSLLEKLHKKNTQLNNTAIVLGDEKLLIPVINSLPEKLDAINITMGLPLKSIPLASLFENLFHLHKNKTNLAVHYQDIVNVLSHSFARPLFIKGKTDYANLIIEDIQKHNLIYVSPERLKQTAVNQSEAIDLLFGNWYDNPTVSIQNCQQLIQKVKDYYNENKKDHILALEYLYRFNEVFNQIKFFLEKYNCIANIKTLFGLFKELLNNESLDFRGEPLQGLQLMGMLESRVLDFETVIISSVNEGILPAGKSNNSFIPFDVKIENNLPTYKEKDAVYSYHFYRLLQRAKNVFILYNTEPDAIKGGEKSRFITQLEIEGIHELHHILISPKVPPISNTQITISKSELIMNRIKEVAEKGFSPSSLTSYIRNPLDFYYQKILRVKQYEDVEETVASNTLGTVVHNTLEDFYKPLIGHFLTIETLKGLKKKIEKTVTFHFKDIYKE
ncbi:MAG: PD-(D/E)XK nuclease family protein, partial [Flavobacteriaceae bacterium]|nr:PD-(D/E)XK nuclease family protein [Flavobacteriaceae bacterium]